MAYSAKLLANGRVTIPAKLRRQMNLLPGDTVKMTLKDGKVYVKASRKSSSA